MRALPKIATAGWMLCSLSVASTNSEIISNILQDSRAEFCERRTSWGSEGFGTLGAVMAMGILPERNERYEETPPAGRRAELFLPRVSCASGVPQPFGRADRRDPRRGEHAEEAQAGFPLGLYRRGPRPPGEDLPRRDLSRLQGDAPGDARAARGADRADDRDHPRARLAGRRGRRRRGRRR